MKDEAEKEIRKMQPVMDSLELNDEKARAVFDMAKSYFNDAKYFLEKGKYLQAFEAAVISWAYVDAGIHLDVFSVDAKFVKLFTK